MINKIDMKIKDKNKNNYYSQHKIQFCTSVQTFFVKYDCKTNYYDRYI